MKTIASMTLAFDPDDPHTREQQQFGIQSGLGLAGIDLRFIFRRSGLEKWDDLFERGVIVFQLTEDDDDTTPTG